MPMSEQYSEDELQWRKALEQYQHAATDIMSVLVTACRENRPMAAANIAHQLTESGNEDLVCLVLGQLTSRIVKAERQAQEAHGPLLTPQEIGVSPEDMTPATWQVAVGDQLEAARKDDDHELWAKMAVDGQIQALLYDLTEQGGPLELNKLLIGMLLVEQQTLALMAAEMLRRLVIHARGRS